MLWPRWVRRVGTPTAPTLRDILADVSTAGLDADDRANAILLVTDGEARDDAQDVLTCEPPCGDGAVNGDETDLNCGGSCPRCCGDLKVCNANDDCQSALCQGGLCRPVHCGGDNLVKDGNETDVNCGGDCETCADGKQCVNPGDCRSNKCSSGVCQAATCDDTFKNGTETDQDCGGNCTTKCALLAGCAVDGDCVSGVCQEGQCRVSHCGGGNSVKDGDESDVNCGGSCTPCPVDKLCNAPSDCASGDCNTVCVVDGCADGDLNGDETGIDCGGSCPNDCGGGQGCLLDGDCISGVCRNCENECDSTCGLFDLQHQACGVDGQLDRLYVEDPRIKTFVVGFAFGQTVSPI